MLLSVLEINKGSGRQYISAVQDYNIVSLNLTFSLKLKTKQKKQTNKTQSQGENINLVIPVCTCFGDNQWTNEVTNMIPDDHFLWDWTPTNNWNDSQEHPAACAISSPTATPTQPRDRGLANTKQTFLVFLPQKKYIWICITLKMRKENSYYKVKQSQE